MNIYVETNFVLELALLQDQSESCEKILQFCEQGSAALYIPAYSLIEPYETLIRRQADRRQLKAELDKQLEQLARTATNSEKLANFRYLTAVLIDSADEEAKRLEQTRARLLNAAMTLPLDQATLRSAVGVRALHDLSPQDAVVYAAIHAHMRDASGHPSCFLTRNSKDFADPDLRAELKAHHCQPFFRFDHGYQYIASHLA